MSSGVNKVILVGHLGADPELRHIPNGSAVCEFRLATNESWNDREGQKQEHTEWHRVSVWGKQAEACSKYLSKGRMAYVEGKVRTRKWQDKDGNDRFTTEIVAHDVQFLGGKGEGEGEGRDSGHGERGGGMPSGAEDDIPF